MIRAIDHLVIACADPDAAATQLESALGLAAGGGGRHEGAGTFNRIAWLADGTYLELLGVDDRATALDNPIGAAAARILDEREAGLVGVALLADDLELTVHALRAADSALGEVRFGTRRRPDGERVEWWSSFPERPPSAGPLPFLIQHAYTGVEWGFEAMQQRAAYRHPIGSPVIMARLDVATDDPPALAAEYHELLGLEMWAVADLAVGILGRHTLRLVRSRDMDVPAVVTLGAEVEGPRTIDALGLRFDVEWVELPLPAPNLA